MADIMTIKYASNMLGVHFRTGLRLVEAGILPTVDVDGIEPRAEGKGPALVLVDAAAVRALHKRHPILPTVGQLRRELDRARDKERVPA